MGERMPIVHPDLDPHEWTRKLARYRKLVVTRSLLELALSAVPFVILWVLIWAALDAGYWIGLLLSLPAAGFLVRLFMIQHDCGHGSFFRSRLANDWLGRAIGVLTLTPYDFWRQSHALHHATSGNLDRRGIGDVKTLTVCEFKAQTRGEQMLYRAYRHPIVLFGLGPAYLFILRHRFPRGLVHSGWGPWIGTMATNVAIAVLVATLMWIVGAGPFLAIQLPISLLAASIGVWLFYVQHQFEKTYWERDERWSFHTAALHGSSHYDLPGLLRWFTANIGVHHIHHLSSRIPCYLLWRVLRDHPELRNVGRLTLRESLNAVRLVLWDEQSRRMVSFGEVNAGAKR
jgi:omega-6 fatty acid desaturase (delta-12 desaturase)